MHANFKCQSKFYGTLPPFSKNTQPKNGCALFPNGNIHVPISCIEIIKLRLSLFRAVCSLLPANPISLYSNSKSKSTTNY